jgi:hypothetical protein
MEKIMKYMIVILALIATGASATELHYSQPSKDIFTDTFITGLSDSTVLFPWGNQTCDTTERIINTYGIGKSYDKRIKILPNTARNGSTALWVRSRDGAWIVIQSNNVDGGRTCIAAWGDRGTKLPNITLGLPETDIEPGQAPVVPVAGGGMGVTPNGKRGRIPSGRTLLPGKYAHSDDDPQQWYMPDSLEFVLTPAEATCKPGPARMTELTNQGYTQRTSVQASKKYPNGMMGVFKNTKTGEWYVLEGDIQSMCINRVGLEVK